MKLEVIPMPRTVETVKEAHAEVDALRQALRPFVLGQVSTKPGGVLVLVSQAQFAEAERVYMDCRGGV